MISYEDGKVKCSMHVGGNEGEEDEEPGEEESWLWAPYELGMSENIKHKM